jgi:hypothetical protein
VDPDLIGNLDLDPDPDPRALEGKNNTPKKKKKKKFLRVLRAGFRYVLISELSVSKCIDTFIIDECMYR